MSNDKVIINSRNSEGKNDEDINEDEIIHNSEEEVEVEEKEKEKLSGTNEESTQLNSSESNLRDLKIVKATTATDIKASIVDGMYCCLFEDCNKKFKNASKFNRHALTHTNERPFVCPYPNCGKSYTRNEHLKRHCCSHSENLEEKKPFLCTYEGCNKRFVTKSKLKRHEQIHINSNLYKCTFEGCTASFSKRNKLTKHILSHSNKLPYCCTYENCEKSFDRPSRLKEHLKTHNKKPKYVCGQEGCTQIFTTWTLLQKHIKSDHKKICPICNTEFSKQYAFKAHMERHNTSKERKKIICPYPDCHKELSSEKVLKIHIRATHEGIKPFVCNVENCGMRFAHKHMLIRHNRVHEKKPNEDKKKKKKEATLIETLTGYDYDQERKIKCYMEGCTKRFKRQYDFERHLMAEHIEEYHRYMESKEEEELDENNIDDEDVDGDDDEYIENLDDDNGSDNNEENGKENLIDQEIMELDEESLEMIEHDLMVDENEKEEKEDDDDNDDDEKEKEEVKEEAEEEKDDNNNIHSNKLGSDISISNNTTSNSRSHSHQIHDALDEVIEESIKLEEQNEIFDSKRKFESLSGEKRTSPAKRNKKNSKKEENIPIINEEQYEAYLSYGRK